MRNTGATSTVVWRFALWSAIPLTSLLGLACNRDESPSHAEKAPCGLERIEGTRPFRAGPPPPPGQWPWETDEEFARKRREAIALIEEEGGWIGYSNSAAAWWDYARYYPPRPVPDQLRDYDGEPLIRFVKFQETWIEAPDEIATVPDNVDDELLLATLPYLPDCRLLKLAYTRVTDKGLAVIKHVPYLARLDLVYGYPQRYPVLITDSGLRAIGRHPSLYRVILQGMPIKDRGIAEIARCDTLERVYVYACPITPKCFLSLTELPALRELSVAWGPDFGVPESYKPHFSDPIGDEVGRALESLDGRLRWLTLDGLDVHPSFLRSALKLTSLNATSRARLERLLRLQSSDNGEAFGGKPVGSAEE